MRRQRAVLRSIRREGSALRPARNLKRSRAAAFDCTGSLAPTSTPGSRSAWTRRGWRARLSAPELGCGIRPTSRERCSGMRWRSWPGRSVLAGRTSRRSSPIHGAGLEFGRTPEGTLNSVRRRSHLLARRIAAPTSDPSSQRHGGQGQCRQLPGPRANASASHWIAAAMRSRRRWSGTMTATLDRRSTTIATKSPSGTCKSHVPPAHRSARIRPWPCPHPGSQGGAWTQPPRTCVVSAFHYSARTIT